MSGAPFQTIPEAARLTGLSQYFIRNGCRAGTVPHIVVHGPKGKSPGKYMVNVPLLLERLNAASMGGGVPLLERDKAREHT